MRSAHLKSDDLHRLPASPGLTADPGPPLPPPQPTGETPEVVRVLRWMDQNGVAAAAAVQHRGTYGVDNRYLLDSTDQYRTRLVPGSWRSMRKIPTPPTWCGRSFLIEQHGLAGVRLTGPRGGAGAMPWLSFRPHIAPGQR